MTLAKRFIMLREGVKALSTLGLITGEEVDELNTLIDDIEDIICLLPRLEPGQEE